MIKQVTLQNSNGELLTIQVEGVGDNPDLLILNMDGISPPKGIINTLLAANVDGSRYNSKRVEDRNITMSLAVGPAGSKEEELRLRLYKTFPIAQPITFGITTDSRDATIEAYVEDHNIHMFSKIENVDVTLKCPEPYFKDVTEQIVRFSGTQGTFVFPFSNNSLTEPLLKFGNIVEYAVHNLLYTGDVETGVVIRLHAKDDTSNIYLYNTSHNQVMHINTTIPIPGLAVGPDIIFGDDIIIDTRIGRKSITLVRDGISYNMINSLGMRSPWLTIKPGMNELSFSSETGLDKLDVELSYHILYEGM